VAGLTTWTLFNTRETVAVETLARFATSSRFMLIAFESLCVFDKPRCKLHGCEETSDSLIARGAVSGGTIKVKESLCF
jgi:hypothetical protein